MLPVDQIEISPFKPEQARAVAQLHALCFNRPWSYETFRRYAGSPSYSCWTAWRQHDLTGFIFASISGEEAEIMTLASDLNMRRQGIAARLLDRLFGDLMARKTIELFLEVSDANDSAIALYRKAGFEVVGNRPGYYISADGREDALIMRRKL